MLTLDDLARKLDSKAITLRGRTITVRALSIAAQVAIAKAFKLPDAPLAPARGKGSAAAFEPDYHDPAYRFAELERSRKIRLVEAMAALGMAARTPATPIGVPAGVNQADWDNYAAAAWIDGSGPGGLALEEVLAVQEALEQLGAGEPVEAAKN